MGPGVGHELLWWFFLRCFAIVVSWSFLFFSPQGLLHAQDFFDPQGLFDRRGF